MVYNNCQEPKQMWNSFVGCWNKKTKKTTRDRFTTDLNDAVRYYFSNENSGYYNPEECPELFHLQSWTTTSLHESMVPLYWQVIGNSRVLSSVKSMEFLYTFLILI